jgi:hypothetical protein
MTNQFYIATIETKNEKYGQLVMKMRRTVQLFCQLCPVFKAEALLIKRANKGCNLNYISKVLIAITVPPLLLRSDNSYSCTKMKQFILIASKSVS